MKMLVLFGSRVRGQEHPHSDWDLGYRARAPNGLTPVVKSRICVAALRCSSVEYVQYSPSSRLGPLATARFHSVRQPVRCSSTTPTA
jgi:hypothetical protein